MENYLIAMIALIYALFITIFLYITLVRKRNSEESLILLKEKTEELNNSIDENSQIKEDNASLKSENKILHELLENANSEKDSLNQEVSKTIKEMLQVRESLYQSENDCASLSHSLEEERKQHLEAEQNIKEKKSEYEQLSALYVKEKKDKEDCWQNLLKEAEKTKELSLQIMRISDEKNQILRNLEEEKAKEESLMANSGSEEKERMDVSMKKLNKEQMKIYDVIHQYICTMKDVSLISKDYFESVVYQKNRKFAQLSITDGKCVIKAGIGKIASADGKMSLYLKPIRFIIHEEKQIEKAETLLQQSLSYLKNKDLQKNTNQF